MTSQKLLVVGGGLTGAVTSALLSASGASLAVWDKGRGAGGRMSTSRMGSDDDVGSTADLGAQYISATVDYMEKHKSFYDDLTGSGVLRPMTARIAGQRDAGNDSVKHFVAPAGSSSIVRHFLNKSKADTHFQRHVDRLSVSGGKWDVSTKDGARESFDLVLLTMPVPQILQLLADSGLKSDIDPETATDLESVRYSSRYAAGIKFDGADNEKLLGEFDAKYISDDPVFRFASVDSAKRGLAADAKNCVSVVLHTSTQFGAKHVEETNEQVKPMLETEVKRAFPDWPEPAACKCHKWRYSQVTDPFPGSPGVVVLRSDPPLLAAGDGFVHSNMDGCVASALKAAEAVSKAISNK